MKILFLFVLLACVAWEATARPQEDGESRPAGRGLLKRGLLAKGKPTTTTTTAAPQEEVEYEDEADYPADGEPQEPSTEAPPSSTEGKKLVGSGVRPFRSNADLLEILKKKRAQAAEAKLNGGVTSAAVAQDSPTEAPVKSSYSKKRTNSPVREVSNEEVSVPAKPSRGRFGRPASRSVPEPELEEQEDVAPPARNSRTFSRGRGGN